MEETLASYARELDRLASTMRRDFPALRMDFKKPEKESTR
jgi:hypothetical protein